jgi:hypothetical protein
MVCPDNVDTLVEALERFEHSTFAQLLLPLWVRQYSPLPKSVSALPHSSSSYVFSATERLTISVRRWGRAQTSLRHHVNRIVAGREA